MLRTMVLNAAIRSKQDLGAGLFTEKSTLSSSLNSCHMIQLARLEAVSKGGSHQSALVLVTGLSDGTG